MSSLSRRVDKIQEQLEPENGPVFRWPNRDGTFIEVRGVRSLNDPKLVLRVASLADVAALMRGAEGDGAYVECSGGVCRDEPKTALAVAREGRRVDDDPCQAQAD